MTQENKQSLIRLLISCGVIGLILVGIYFVLKHFGWTDLTQEEIQEIVQSYGTLAPLIFIGISFLQVTFVPIPGMVTILAGNYVFGPLESFLYSYIGMLAGGMAGFGLGKLLGRPFVNWVAGSKEKVDEWLVKMRGREGVLLFFMFLFPLFPDDILCSVAGLLPFTWGGFLCLQLVTRATSIGGTLIFMSGEVVPLNFWGISLIVVGSIACVAAFVFCIYYAEAIDTWFSNLFRKVYYGEKYFWRKKEGRISGKKIFVGTKFRTKNSSWRIAGLYLCPEGFVLDIYSRSVKKHNQLPKLDFDSYLLLNGEKIECEKRFRHMSHAKGTYSGRHDCIKVKEFVKHYKVELLQSRKFVRSCYPSTVDKNLDNLKDLTLVICQDGDETKTKEFKLISEKKTIKELLSEFFDKKQKQEKK
ncbi:MAG: TVP38/TMEM64 family protein [Clostridia bacterium]|nr:TVP38/TMEM64 family protein [Clostridia bacterium]